MAKQEVLKTSDESSSSSDEGEISLKSIKRKVSDDEEISAYELLRLKNIEEKNKLLRSLGIDKDIEEFKQLNESVGTPVREKSTTPSRKNRKVPVALPRREPSRRLRKLAAANADKDKIYEEMDKGEKEEVEDVDRRLLGSVRMEIEKESSFLAENLKELKQSVKFDPDIDLKSCDFEKFRDTMLCLNMIPTPPKVVPKRIQSVHVHPSRSKSLVIAGSTAGHLGLWDLEAGTENGIIEFSPHRAPTNCITTSITDPTKIFSTSHDGTVVCADLEKTLFTNIFATDYNAALRHLTWHDQRDASTLLLTHGDGKVGLLDLRSPQVCQRWIPCFNRSARTVHFHPTTTDYFLVSSGAGVSCKVFDLRTCSGSAAPSTAEMLHPRPLTSAFFSPNGSQILTTSNDDRLRVFSYSVDSQPAVKRSILHNNHTGRWLSVFKAVWHPQREGVFFVGSLLSPRRIQMYSTDGQLQAELRSENMSTISPVLGLHPTVPFLVGGNSSGRVHAFVSPAVRYVL